MSSLKSKKLPLAIQLYSVRSLLNGPDFKDTLNKLADIGFTAVELFGGRFGGLSPEQLADFLKSVGIRAVGMHVDVDTLQKPESATYDYARALACEFITVSMPQPVTTDRPNAVAQLKNSTAVAAAQGLTLTYHNHAGEFVKTADGRPALDRLFEDTGDFKLQFQLDVFFTYYSGFDPCDYLRRFTGRVPQIHLNDLAATGRGKVDPETGGQCFSTELGTGCMDLPQIYRAALAAGARWIILEQHALRDDPLASARRNFAYYANIPA